MAFIKGQKVGKLKVILLEEGIKIRELHKAMSMQCVKMNIKPVMEQELSKISYGDKPDRFVSTYLKILNAVNALRNRKEPYTLYDLIEPDEILKPRK